MKALLQWTKRHEGLSWAGLILGIGGILGSPRFGLETAPGLALIGMGGLLVGAIGGAKLAIRRRKRNVVCHECEQVYEFRGRRGQDCRITITMLLEAKAPIESFVHSKVRATGNRDRHSVRFRNLGPRGRDNPNPPAYYELGRGQLFETGDPSGEYTLVVFLPAQIEKGDRFEVLQVVRAKDCFEQEDEFVGKTVIFEIKKLRFSLRFLEGLGVGNCAATSFETEVPVGHWPLTPTTSEGITELHWEVPDALPGEFHRVAWRWDDEGATAPEA